MRGCCLVPDEEWCALEQVTPALLCWRHRNTCDFLALPRIGGRSGVDRYPPAIVKPSIRTVGESVPRRNTKSEAATMLANISIKLPATVTSATGSATAVADHEAGRTSAVVPGHTVHAHADHFGDVEAFLDIGHEFLRCDGYGCQV